MMGLGAFLAVLLGDITFSQIVGGAALGFIAAIPVYRFISLAECEDDAEADLPDWYDLDDRSEALGAFRQSFAI
jgi:hypothetical protein